MRLEAPRRGRGAGRLGRGLRPAGAPAGGRGRRRCAPRTPTPCRRRPCDLLGGQYADALGLRVVRVRAVQPRRAGPARRLRGRDAHAPGGGGRGGRRRGVRASHRQPRLGARLHGRARRRARLRRRRRRSSPDAYNVCERAGGERARADRAGARRRHACRCATRSTRSACAPTTCPRCAARPSGCGPPPAGRREIPLEQTVADALEAWRQRMRMAVVIVTHNSADHIGATLRALAAQLEQGDELVVVDNASSDAHARRRSLSGDTGPAAGAAGQPAASPQVATPGRPRHPLRCSCS